MCPLRLILIFLSATLAGFFVIRNLKSQKPPDDVFDADENTDNNSTTQHSSSSKVRIALESGFWTFLDMASDTTTIKIMAENSGSNGNNGVCVTFKDCDDAIQNCPPPPASSSCDKTDSIYFSVPFMQKLVAEVLGTYFMIFAGCMAVVVNMNKDKTVTHPGISIVWGLVVMANIYSLGHISGAHFNPSVTIAFATCKRFPWKQVPAYIACQVLGSTMAAGTIRLLFQGKEDHFVGTSPAGSNIQAFVIEFIITFYLMFVVSGVSTDNRAIGELAGLAVGSTVLLNVLFAGPITGASMNPARSLGPAIVSHQYEGLWLYIVAPPLGATAGALIYNMVRYTDKPLREITKSASFLKSSGRS